MRLELKNIYKNYGEHTIFSDLSIDFSNPGFYLLSGKSGSGKSTLLNMIAGFEPYRSGQRIVENMRMAYIFQSYELLTELTVLENIKIATDIQKNEFDNTLLEKLGLMPLLNHYPNELSGGEKQRVGIARALYQNPNVIICDKPTESLDIDNKILVLKLLKSLAKERVVIVSSHELQYILPYADFHYQIQDETLVCLKQNENKESSIAENQPLNLQISAVKYYLHRIISKRTLLESILFFLLILIQIGLHTLEASLTKPKDSLDSLNSHILYVTLYDTYTDFLDQMDLEVKLLLNFKPVQFDEKAYLIHIYPLENTTYALKNDEILINQHVLPLLGKDVSKLTLTYEIEGNQFSKEMKIIKVVEEKDAYYPQIYYSYDSLISDLKEQNSYLYEIFIAKANQYEIISDFQHVESLYHSLSYLDEITVSHALFDTRVQNYNQLPLYHVFFSTVQVIILVATLFSILYFNKKDGQHNKAALSLLCSLQVPSKILKWEYYKQKARYMLLSGISLVIIFLVLASLIDVFSLSLACLYLTFIIIVYLISLGIQILRFKNKDIALILKENKDF